MGLDDSVVEFVNQLIYVKPHYGYGWSGVPDDELGGPPPFKARLQRFWDAYGERRGGVARVEEPGHKYDGYWVVFWTRQVGECNFTDRPGRFNIVMSPDEPFEEDKGWESMEGASPRLMGFAEVTAGSKT